MEVTEEDLVVGYVSQSAKRMKEVCEKHSAGCCSSTRPTGWFLDAPTRRPGHRSVTPIWAFREIVVGSQ
jgi:hypothetical protein